MQKVHLLLLHNHLPLFLQIRIHIIKIPFPVYHTFVNLEPFHPGILPDIHPVDMLERMLSHVRRHFLKRHCSL